MATEEQPRIIEIDGSIMEGGGQILRMSIAFSCLTRKPIRIVKIRAGRKGPGLKAQHLMGLRLVAQICQGKLTGDQQGSCEVTFVPGEIAAGNYEADTKTAGSVALLLQVALPCLLFAKGTSTLILKGGTNAEMAPPIDYMGSVVKSSLEKMGARFDVNVIKRGFFPKGGGIVEITVHPVAGALKPIALNDFGELTSIGGLSYVCGTIPMKIVHTMAQEAERELRCSNAFQNQLEIKISRTRFDESKAVPSGSGLCLEAKTTTGCLLASSSIGSKKYSAEQVGKAAAVELAKVLRLKACVDEHLQDQLVLFMAIASGKSLVKAGEITLHTETAIYIAEKLTKAKFNITASGDGSGCSEIECEGFGYNS